MERIGIREEMKAEEPDVMDCLLAEAKQTNADRRARVLNIPGDLDAPNDGAASVNTGCQIPAVVLVELSAVQVVRTANRGVRVDAAKAFRLLMLGHIVFAGSKPRTIRH
ncbi:MAG: hypothetical protein LBJ02_08395 [Bifidobacteriaceae bacterium]|nr:hypothetical protein [Bifidobacteriaceae bacterium]